jgi:predicted  nucleic acid-binding Zn-ribbon protein
MIQAIMLIALGFLTASLIGVLLAPSLWARAYRLSRKRLEGTLPLTLAEIEATQDQLRASYAVRLRRLETTLATTKQKAAMQLVENSRLQMQIVALKDQISDIDLKLAERRNAAAVLEQTITKRFPELDREITAVKAQLQERSFDLQDLTNRLGRRDEELAAAERAAAAYEEELNRLRQVLEKGSGDRSGRRLRRASQWGLDDYRAEYDRLNLELSKLRQQLAQLQDRDAQQVTVIKGELQKLAELILVSAQPKAETRVTEPAERTPMRTSAREMRLGRPVPWPEASPAPLSKPEERPEMSAPEPTSTTPIPEQRLPGLGGSQPGMATASLSSVLDSLPDDIVLEPVASRESSEPGEVLVDEPLGPRSRIVLGVVTEKPTPGAAEEAREPPKTITANDLQRLGQDKNGSADDTGEQSHPKPDGVEAGPLSRESPTDIRQTESEKIFADARDLKSISELAALSSSNGSRFEIEPPAEAKSSQILDSGPSTPGEAKEEASTSPQNRTLLDRLRGVAETSAEADK